MPLSEGARGEAIRRRQDRAKKRGPTESARHWLSTHFSVASPVDQMLKRSKLAERTFKRRFVIATGLTPIAYVQRLRIEDAKKRLD